MNHKNKQQKKEQKQKQKQTAVVTVAKELKYRICVSLNSFLISQLVRSSIEVAQL